MIRGDDATELSLRRFQGDFMQAVKDINDGRFSGKLIVVFACPGAGKSLLPITLGVILSHLKICWAVPRNSLREQGAKNFLDPGFRELLGHSLRIREAVNEDDPARDENGYTTTHQAISENNVSHIKAFSKDDYVLVIDEGHHIAAGGPTHKAFMPLYDRAKLVVIISGLIERGDKKRIAFLPYEREGENTFKVASRSSDHMRWIQYELSDALREKAIIPIYFKHADGPTKYIDRGGDEQEREKIGDDSDALFTAVSTELATDMLNEGIKDWQGYQRKYKHAKLLVVCARQKEAKRYAKMLKTEMDINAAVAVSDDGKAAANQIRRFTNGEIDCLVTVAMAYEGMDVPSITHMVCLTHIRSRGWIFQMLGRCWRVDKDAIEAGIPYESQRGIVFVPDDDMMSEIIKTIEMIRDKALKERGEREGGEGGCGGNPNPPVGDIIPISSAKSSMRGTHILGEELTAEEFNHYHAIIKKGNLVGRVDEIELKSLLTFLTDDDDEKHLPHDNVETVMTPLTPRQEEDRIRAEIDGYLKSYTWENGMEWGTPDTILRKEGWKKRDDLGLKKLKELWVHIHRRFPREHQGQA